MHTEPPQCINHSSGFPQGSDPHEYAPGSWGPYLLVCVRRLGTMVCLPAPFSYGAKKSCRFFRLLSLVSTEWRLRAPYEQNWTSGSPPHLFFPRLTDSCVLLVSLFSFLCVFIIIQLQILPQFSKSPFSVFMRCQYPPHSPSQALSGALSASAQLAPLSPTPESSHLCLMLDS